MPNVDRHHLFWRMPTHSYLGGRQVF